MAQYMAQRIIDDVYTYAYVIGKKSNLKVGIDAYLIKKGRTDLIA